MKKTLGVVSAILIILVIAGTAGATLVTISDDIFFDDTNNLYWLDNPGDFRSMSLTTQLSQIANTSLTVGSDFYDAWEMATQQQVSELYNAYAAVVADWRDVFDFTWIYTPDDTYDIYELTGNSISSSGYNGGHVRLTELLGGGGSMLAFNDYSTPLDAWVVMATAPSSVPEPATMLLLGSGLIGLVGFRRKFKN